MRTLLLLGAACSLLFACNNTQYDFEDLIGTWQAINPDVRYEGEGDPLYFMQDILAAPVLEIIDPTSDKFTMVGIKGPGTIIIDEYSKSMYMQWEGQEIEMDYDLTQKGKVVMKFGSKDLIFEKISDKTSVIPGASAVPKIDVSFLLGEWTLTQKVGGKGSDYIIKQSGAVYHFMENDQLEIVYKNGTYDQGFFYLKENEKLALALGDAFKKLTIDLEDNQTIYLIEETTGEVLLLKRN